MNSKASKFFWVLLTVGSLVGGGFLTTLSLLPFGVLKPLADRLSRDGSLASFTQESFSRDIPFLAGVGIGLLLAGVVLLLARRRTQGWLERLGAFLGAEWRALRVDTRLFFAALAAHRPAPRTVVSVLLLTLAAAATRLVFISRFFSHDEAYTFEAFAVRPLIKVISDYHLPNNHIFHTILVHFSYLLFGDAPWAVRLPAFLAGVLMVPVAFLLARRWYGWNTALLAAALVAVAPVMISYSTNARGYTLMALITLLTWTLGTYLKDHKNRFGWLALSVLSALGFYTLPVFLYPYGILLTWLVLSSQAGDRSGEYAGRRGLMRYLAASGLVTVGLTLLLYSPVFLVSGVSSVTGNTFVQPLSLSDFFQTLPLRLNDTWEAFSQDWPGIVWAVLVAGVALSLGLHKWIARRDRIPAQLAVLAWLVPIFLLQRPNPWAKVWTYLFAPLMIWAAAGVLALFKDMYLNRGRRWPLQTALAVVLTVLLLAWNGFYSQQNFVNSNNPWEIERTAAYLKTELRAGDFVVVTAPNDSVFWYYARRQQIPPAYFFGSRDRTYERAVVIVNPTYGQTLESVLQERGPLLQPCQVGTVAQIQQVGSTIIYACDRPTNPPQDMGH